MLCKICKVSELKLQKVFTKANKGENLFGINYRIYKRKLYKCDCGHFFNIHSHSSFLTKIYKKNYAYVSHKDLNKKFNIILALKKKSSNYQRVNFLKKKINIDKNILDIGSGFGIFPYEMQKNEFKIDASETSIDMVNFMKKKKINCHFIDILNNKNKIRKKYDVITLNKVLEHFNLKNIKMVLKKIKYILKDKGIIYIELPSSTAAKESFNRQEFYFEHFNIFSEKSFKILLKQLGYKILYLKDIYEINKKYTIRAIISPTKFYKNEKN